MKKGYPEDHVALTRHMNIPIFDGDHIVAVAGVGNKAEEYNESDVRQLTLLMQGMWSLIQRKQIEDALKQYSDELKMANEELRSVSIMKSEFIAERMGLESTHELPDCSILHDEMIRAIDDQQAKSINSVLLNSERLKRMVNSLLYMSQEQAGKLKYDFSRVQLGKLISEAVMDLILLIDAKGIELEVNVADGLSAIRADKSKLTETLIILIDNAVKFTPESGRISIDLSEENDHLHLRIADTGPGIQKDLIPHIFQKFYQMEDAMSRMYQGLEAGLYICKDIILEHKGEIWIESEKGKGTTFHIRLPVEVVEDDSSRITKK
jgi:signal transduction histidine kinase